MNSSSCTPPVRSAKASSLRRRPVLLRESANSFHQQTNSLRRKLLRRRRQKLAKKREDASARRILPLARLRGSVRHHHDGLDVATRLHVFERALPVGELVDAAQHLLGLKSTRREQSENALPGRP